MNLYVFAPSQFLSRPLIYRMLPNAVVHQHPSRRSWYRVWAMFPMGQLYLVLPYENTSGYIKIIRRATPFEFAQSHTPDVVSRSALYHRPRSRFRVGESAAISAPIVWASCLCDESEPWAFETIAAIWALCFIKASCLEVRSASMDFLAWIYAPPPAEKRLDC